MKSINIKSQKELFNRVKPALRCKKHELFSCGINYISELDIWNYNKNNNWKYMKGLTLSKVVDDILNTPNKEYERFVLVKLNTEKDVI
jgi:hypothetical protein